MRLPKWTGIAARGSHPKKWLREKEEAKTEGWVQG